jgi:FkbM family methyltransferase
MISIIKKSIHQVLKKSGYDIHKVKPFKIGDNPHKDMEFFLRKTESPNIFDVGANIGQSVELFKSLFPNSSIHSFEPSPSTFKILQNNVLFEKDIITNNIGLGAKQGNLLFKENSHSDMSSFLKLNKDGWGEVNKETLIPIDTIDKYCAKNNINKIDILKSDTQGYDFEVFKGAQKMMNENRIKIIYFEFIFSSMYVDLPSFDEVYKYLTNNNFLLVNFYKSHMRKNLVSWNDLMFINKEFYDDIHK